MARAWANSLFEDNAEFGYGMRVAAAQREALVAQKVDEVLENGCADELKAAFGKLESQPSRWFGVSGSGGSGQGFVAGSYQGRQQECGGAGGH